MAFEKRVDINDIKGMVFRCECGGTARVEVDDGGIFCDVNSPQVSVRVLMKPFTQGGDPWTAWEVREGGDA